MAVPLVREGRLRALLFVHRSDVHRWTSDEVALIELVAARIWDAAERARAEAALRDSEAHLSGIFHQTGAGFAEVDAGGRFLSVNDRFCAMAGRSRAALLDLGVAEITHPDDEAASRRALGLAMAGEAATVEKRLLRPDGSVLWVANTKCLIAPVAGRRTVLTVAIDITERKAVERALADAKLAAEEANVAKSTFIANMSHELRTPLSAIIGYSEMMLEEAEDGAGAADLAVDLRKVESNARHLLGLINDVLDLSKVESGKMEVYVESFDIAPMVEDVASAVQSLVGKKRNRLEVKLDPGLGTMQSDFTKVRQMLLNLLSNAAKFTEDGGIVLSASREAGPGGRVLFAVSDTGVGMSEEQLGRLFQRFTQADASTTRRFGGTGLGLSLTRAFADMLGGTVSVASGLGRGTTFTVALPPAYTPPAAEEAEPVGGPEEGGARDHVLVIDDDADQRAIMARFLAREGFRARTAGDGQAGLDLAREARPRAILLDVMMPGLDGWSVLSALKSDPDLRDIPVVMVTFVEQRGLAASLGGCRLRHEAGALGAIQGRDGPLPRSPGRRARRRARGRRRSRHPRQGPRHAGARRLGRDGGRERPRCARPVPAGQAFGGAALTMPVMDGFDCLAALRARPDGAEVPVVVLTALDLSREDRRRLAGANQVLDKGDVSLKALVEKLQRLVGGSPREVGP